MTHSLISAAILLTTLEPHLVIFEGRNLAQDGFGQPFNHEAGLQAKAP